MLLGVLTALLAALGYYFGGLQLGLIFLAFGVVMNLVMYWFSDRIALLMNKAQPLPEADAGWLYSEVREMTRRMGIPMVRLFTSPSPQPNAFAAGRTPSKSVVCLTQGLLNSLDQNEIRAVVAHELGHVRNYDVLLATVAAVVASAISFLANIAIRVSIFRGRDGESKGGGAGGLLFLIIAPIVALLIQLAISRTREYAADEAAAEVTGRPRDLAGALVKISETVKGVPMDVNPALSSLYIQNPFKGAGFVEIFSTHPRVEKRIERLLAMDKKSVI